MNLIQFQNKFSEICKNDPNHIEGYSVSFTTEGGKPHITIKQGEIQLDYGMEMPVIAPDAEIDADYLSQFHESLAAFGGSLQEFDLEAIVKNCGGVRRSRKQLDADIQKAFVFRIEASFTIAYLMQNIEIMMNELN